MLRQLCFAPAALQAAARIAAATTSAVRGHWTPAPPLPGTDEHSHGGFGDDDGTHVRSEEDKRQLVEQILRETQAAEEAATKYFAAQQVASGNSPDVAFFKEQEQEQLASVQKLMPEHHVRPSLLLGVAQAAGAGLGMVAALAPRPISNAVTGALQDALSDVYTDALRRLREAGLSDEATEVRNTLKRLRDVERAPHGAPPAPDIVALQRMEKVGDIGVQGMVGAIVKAGTRAALDVTRRI